MIARRYRHKASEFFAKAECEATPYIREQFEHLARGYLRLALQAERNKELDLVYETPPPKLDGR